MLPARNVYDHGTRMGRGKSVGLGLRLGRPLMLGLPVLGLLLGLGLIGGCITGPKLIVESPLSSEDQQKEILKIAPIGTDRKEVLKRLDRAGIQYIEGAGYSSTTWYCTFWKKANGDRWHLDVALLFDASGKLYETRRRDSDTGVADGNSLDPAANSERTTSADSGTGAVPEDTAARESTRGSAPRSPFGK